MSIVLCTSYSVLFEARYIFEIECFLLVSSVRILMLKLLDIVHFSGDDFHLILQVSP